jgi:CubicO group peptidase (beta-lactamase class C family)
MELLRFFHPLLRVAIFAAAMAANGFALAQPEVPAGQENLPPVAAPTASIQVGAIPVVRSQSQEVDDFAAGLMQGLMAVYHLPGAAMVIVKDDHVMTAKGFGDAAPDTPFAAGSLGDFFATLSLMQTVESGKITTSEDVARVLGDPSPQGSTLAEVLAREKGDTALLGQLAAKASSPWR